MMAKQKQIVKKADSSASSKANPCGHPVCTFVEQTTGCVGSRLT